MIKKKNESGRSMVEMLGVLAIIGVLSIGGIAGYTMSMRRHRANMIVDVINKYALISYNACQQAVINGTLEDVTKCKSTIPPSYKDSDLTKPSELSGMIFVGVTQSSGNDTVQVNAFIYGYELCKAVESITGKNDHDPCESAGGPLGLAVFINFN